MIFFQDILTTALEPDEILTEIIVPKIPDNSGAAFVEIARRHGDFAISGVAAQISFEDRMPSVVGLAACGAGPIAMRLTATEEILLEEGIGEKAVKAAAAAAAANRPPPSTTGFAPKRPPPPAALGALVGAGFSHRSCSKYHFTGSKR